MAIFELSMVNYPRNHLRFIDLTTYEKAYISVLNFQSIMVHVEWYRLLEHTLYEKTDIVKTLPTGPSTKQRVVLLLFSPSYALIMAN